MTEQTSLLNEISGALDTLGTSVQNMRNDDLSFSELYGWNAPSMSFRDLATYIRAPKQRIQNIIEQNAMIESADLEVLKLVPARITYIQGNTIPQLSNSSYTSSVVSIVLTFVNWLELILTKYEYQPLEFKAIQDKNILPAQQLRALKSTDAAIKKLESEVGNLEDKIVRINEANNYAQALPADLQSIQEARDRYDQAEKDLKATIKNIDNSRVELNNLETTLKEREKEINEVLRKANAAYSAATTIGLGKAFLDKSRAIGGTTWLLILALAGVLYSALKISSEGVKFAHQLMTTSGIETGILWMNMSVTGFSLFAPIWAAWFLTRQIGLRFRIAEDYAYKATVAKAYEGYRNEAANIDDELSKKLFQTAIERLSENPIRLVDKDNPGSPAHDLQQGAKLELPNPLKNLIGQDKSNE